MNGSGYSATDSDFSTLSGNQINYPALLFMQMERINRFGSFGDTEAYVRAVDILETNLWAYMTSFRSNKSFKTLINEEIKKVLEDEGADYVKKGDKPQHTEYLKYKIALAKHKVLMEVMKTRVLTPMEDIVDEIEEFVEDEASTL